MNLNEQLDDNFSEEELGVEERVAFLEAVKWSKKLVIMMGIMLGLGAFLFLGFAFFEGEGGIAIVLMVFMLLFGGVPFYFLYQFTTKTKKAIESLDDVLFTSALQNLKSFFKFWGILTLLLIAYYVFVILLIVINVSSF